MINPLRRKKRSWRNRPLVDHDGQILVGGGDEAHVDRNRPDPSHPFDLSLLDDPQQLGWVSIGMSPISSMKSVPPSAASNLPGLRAVAPVKAPFS